VQGTASRQRWQHRAQFWRLLPTELAHRTSPPRHRCCPPALARRRYQGHVSAALVLGGVDFRGPHLFTVYPHGSTDSLPFATMGSGSLNAMAVFEAGYKDDLSREEAMDLVARAIRQAKRMVQEGGGGGAPRAAGQRRNGGRRSMGRGVAGAASRCNMRLVPVADGVNLPLPPHQPMRLSPGLSRALLSWPRWALPLQVWRHERPGQRQQRGPVHNHERRGGVPAQPRVPAGQDLPAAVPPALCGGVGT
jgi:hypothetical protein